MEICKPPPKFYRGDDMKRVRLLLTAAFAALALTAAACSSPTGPDHTIGSGNHTIGSGNHTIGSGNHTIGSGN
jgi:hypothetical protein